MRSPQPRPPTRRPRRSGPARRPCGSWRARWQRWRPGPSGRPRGRRSWSTALEEARGRARSRPRGGRPRERPSRTRPEEAPATWLRPVYTREFYDSLEGWDLRIQRAAFKQANLLAQDHRHPSLRALPLEGLPGYYRVRVATDVRLLYRRGERQNEVEILSLIDREDLDRYVRQAKTR